MVIGEDDPFTISKREEKKALHPGRETSQQKGEVVDRYDSLSKLFGFRFLVVISWELIHCLNFKFV